jgi:glycosyltransferase involved in cell wall biosynthesis
MPAPLISVLIPCYKAARFIEAALACVREQTIQDWEVVVVEDGSNDGTESIVAAFASSTTRQVRYHNLGTNQGVSAARNALMAQATGTYYAFLDADDHWGPGHLEDLLRCLLQGHALAFTGIELWDGDRGASLGFHSPAQDRLATPRLSLFRESLIMTSSCVALPAESFRRIGFFDTSLRIGEDRDYWFRCLENGASLGFTGRTSCRYTKSSGSSMSGTLRWLEDTVKFYRKHQNAMDIPENIRREKLRSALADRARVLLRSQPSVACECLAEARQLGPFSLALTLRHAAAALLKRVPFPR